MCYVQACQKGVVDDVVEVSSPALQLLRLFEPRAAVAEVPTKQDQEAAATKDKARPTTISSIKKKKKNGGESMRRSLMAGLKSLAGLIGSGEGEKEKDKGGEKGEGKKKKLQWHYSSSNDTTTTITTLSSSKKSSITPTAVSPPSTSRDVLQQISTNTPSSTSSSHSHSSQSSSSPSTDKENTVPRVSHKCGSTITTKATTATKGSAGLQGLEGSGLQPLSLAHLMAITTKARVKSNSNLLFPSRGRSSTTPSGFATDLKAIENQQPKRGRLAPKVRPT